MNNVRPTDAFIFMKVGDHAGESFNDILRRKNAEYRAAGKVFWGYGGAACHPLNQVQPFARTHLRKQGSIYLVMEPVISNADPDIVPAREYSADGVNWMPIPDGINVTGSKYALVLGEIQPGELEIPLDGYVVGIGPSRGKVADQYLRGRVDKACLEPIPEAAADHDLSKGVRRGKFVAALQEPYAVILR